ncbi:hypothetical protein LRS71_24505 [Rhodococcus pyridinivorans]|uniref:hypothetical protein n=1 Tax=Rhodococcus pyridinivorans TaxID=103816 RepID=UPI001E2D0A06|nr:hypothetical protein [Rhodococcus pyridinivorans]MCD5422676.1 hypothetical protein [Rhodococcus pyridinivorans]
MSEWRHLPAGKIARQRREIVRLEPGVEYRTMGVRWYGKGAYDRGIVTTETVKAKHLYRAREGDFTFNRIDTDKGAFDVVSTELDGALTTNEFPLYEVDEEEIDTRFLLLYFQSPEVLRQIGAVRAGSEGRARWNPTANTLVVSDEVPITVPGKTSPCGAPAPGVPVRGHGFFSTPVPLGSVMPSTHPSRQYRR